MFSGASSSNRSMIGGAGVVAGRASASSMARTVRSASATVGVAMTRSTTRSISAWTMPPVPAQPLDLLGHARMIDRDHGERVDPPAHGLHALDDTGSVVLVLELDQGPALPPGEALRRGFERDVGPKARLLFHLDGGGRLVGVSGVGPSALGRELRIGQIMIERGLAPDPPAFAEPATKLKALLR
jgi:Reductase C-terminal